MLKTLIIATVLLPRLAIAQQSRATTATETARPMVPGGLDGERQLLRTGLRQGAGRYSQERLVSGRLARERQLLHPLRCEQRHCAPARLGRGGFSEAAMPHYRSAHQRRFPEPFVREIEERFGDCFHTDHSAGRGNGMSVSWPENSQTRPNVSTAANARHDAVLAADRT